MSDGERVRQVMAGHNSAYDELVRRWSARVLAICHARVGRGDVAEELAQETLVRGFRAIGSLTEPEKFGQWIGGIATRVCLDWLKHKDRRQVHLSAMANGDHQPDFPDQRRGEDMDEKEDLEKLMQEVERLPEKHREALMLYYYQDSTYEELARVLGVSAATVNARLTQARQMLRQRLVRPVS